MILTHMDKQISLAGFIIYKHTVFLSCSTKIYVLVHMFSSLVKSKDKSRIIPWHRCAGKTVKGAQCLTSTAAHSSQRWDPHSYKVMAYPSNM